MGISVDVIIVLGIVFWLAGGADWVAAKVDELKINNERRRLLNQRLSAKQNDGDQPD